MAEAAQQSNVEKEIDKNSFPECLFPDDKPYEDREEEVRGYSDSEGVEDYFKKFREDQRRAFMQDLSEVSIELDNKEEELKELSKGIRSEIKDLASQRKTILKNIRTGAVWTTETLFRIVDEKTKMVGVYDRHGFLQRIEKLKRGRGLQTTIKPLPKPSED